MLCVPLELYSLLSEIISGSNNIGINLISCLQIAKLITLNTEFHVN